MSKEAMKLALEALKELVAQTDGSLFAVKHDHVALQNARQAITALQKALANEAIDKKAENARELGLDYEPAQQPQRWAVFCQGCRKEWSVSYPHPGKDICVDCDDKPAQQDSTCSNALRAQGKACPRICKKCGLGPCIADRVQPAQRTWVGLTDKERIMCRSYDPEEAVAKTEAKLKEKNT